MAAPASEVEYCLVSEEQEEDKKSVNKREGDDVPDSDRGDLKKLKESHNNNNNNKAHKSEYPFSFFYGSGDGKDTVYPDDEEDMPMPRDADEREKIRRARGPPIYISNKKAIEEARKLRAFNRTHGMLFRAESTKPQRSRSPPPPPPRSPPPPSIDFEEQMRLLDEHVKQLWNTHHPHARGLLESC